MADKENKKNWFVRHKLLTVVLAFVAIAVIVSATGGGSKPDSPSNNASNGKPATGGKTQAVKIGQAANDGKFEFTVKGVQCGQPSVGSNEFLTKTAQGQYCLLNVTVRNIGNEKQSLLSSNQKLLDADNKEYSADDTATLYAAPQGSSWYNDINPGNSVEGQIVFDVPKTVSPTAAQLHDSAFSNGVKVSLRQP